MCGSENIKSKQTRTNVQRALNRIVSRLSQLKVIPENGLVIFCGEIIVRNDKTDFEYYCLNPPSPVSSFKYMCNSVFEIEEATKLALSLDKYGLLVLDLHEACWGYLDGERISVINITDSMVPNKHSKGGQSAQRFERLRDVAINEFFVKIGDRVSASFLNDISNMKGILIGGCGLTKDEFVKGKYLHHEIMKKIIGTFDTCYTNDYGLKELVNNSRSELSSLQLSSEKKYMDEFLKQISVDISKCTYGYQNVISEAKFGKIKYILLSSDKQNLVNELYEISEQFNFKIEMIAGESESGKILNMAFGGIAAMLRY